MKLRIFSILVIGSLLLSACGALGNIIPGGSVTVSIVYGSEKQAWLDPLIKQFNDAHNKTADGKKFVVEAQPYGPIEQENGIITGTPHPRCCGPLPPIFFPAQ